VHFARFSVLGRVFGRLSEPGRFFRPFIRAGPCRPGKSLFYREFTGPTRSGSALVRLCFGWALLWVYLSLHRAGSAGAVDDLDRLIGGKDEDFAVADVAFGAGSSNVDNRVDRPLQEIVVDDNFQHRLAQ